MKQNPLDIKLGDVLKIHRNIQGSPEAWGILLFNILLLLFLFLDPEAKYLVVAAYFLETLIIGIFNVIKMFIISVFNPGQGSTPGGGATSVAPKTRMGSLGSGLFYIVFFIFHFGLFYFVQLTFVVVMIGSRGGGESSFIPDPVRFFGATLGEQGLYIFLTLLAYQLFSLLHTFLLKGEYKERSVMAQGMQPYGRIIIQQFVVLIGGFFIILFNGALVLSLLLIIIKTFVDIYAQKYMDAAMMKQLEDTFPTNGK